MASAGKPYRLLQFSNLVKKKKKNHSFSTSLDVYWISTSFPPRQWSILCLAYSRRAATSGPEG